MVYAKRRRKQSCFLQQFWQFNVLNRINESVRLGLHRNKENERRSLSFPYAVSRYLIERLISRLVSRVLMTSRLSDFLRLRPTPRESLMRLPLL